MCNFLAQNLNWARSPISGERRVVRLYDEYVRHLCQDIRECFSDDMHENATIYDTRE